jgi:flagellar hook-associated protein 2
MALGPVSFQGITTNFDFKTIISAILNADRVPITLLTAKQQLLDAKKSAFTDLSTRLSSLRGILTSLADPAALSGRTATSGDATVFTATAASSADVANHLIQVKTLAKADAVRSDALSDRSDPAVTDGRITIKSGGKALITLDVSASTGNNSLNAVRDQINAANAGVSASIVNDGTGDLLVVRASATGTANALSITDTTNLGLTKPGNVIETAADASLVVDGIPVTSSSNTVSTAISGVTLNLLAGKPGTTLSLSVSPDTAAVKGKISDFVDAYNSVALKINEQFFADKTTGQAGPLAGDSLVRSIQSTLQTTISAGVGGLSSSGITTLGALGLKLNGETGLLDIDDAKLTAALTDHYDEVSRLFSPSGSSSDASVSYGGVSAATKAGTYAIAVTTAAERATLAGSAVVRAGGLAADESLTVKLGSATATVALSAGDTADQAVSKLNTGLASAGVDVRAINDGGRIRLNSIGYGSATKISVVSNVADAGDGSSTGFGTTLANDSGVDIAGKINGVAATGNGTVLTGAAGDASEGLSISIATDAAGIAGKGGSFGTITVSRGVADSLSSALKGIVDPTGGLIQNVVTGYDTQTRGITDQIADINRRLTDREALLVAQFSAAESAINSLAQQQTSLTAVGK